MKAHSGHGRFDVRWALPLALAVVPSVALAQESAAPPQPQPALQTEPPEQLVDFSLDLGAGLDVGVAWPNLDAKSAEELAALPEDAVEAGQAAGTNGAGGLSAEQVAEGWVLEDTETASVADTEPAIADDGAERRYRIVLRGLEGISDPLFRDRFNSLSVLQEQRGKPANIAQINRRMRLDTDLLDHLLRAKGYYDAVIRPSARPSAVEDENRIVVTFDTRPGERYLLSRVSLPGLAVAAERAPVLRSAFPVTVGQPVDADAIFGGRDVLTKALGANGFPFAIVEEPIVTVDHETRKGELEMVVRAGGYRRFGAIVVDERPEQRLFSPRHLSRIARFDPGDVYNAADVDDLRRAIIATGLASSVMVKPRDHGDGEHVDIAVSALPGPVRSISGEIGYGTGEGYRLQATWQHRNFFPPEGALAVNGLLGTKEQSVGVTYRRNNFLRRDHVLSSGISAKHQRVDAYESKSVGLNVNLERQTNILYQKKWVWSIGAELSASQEQDIFAGSATLTKRNYFIAALPGSLTYDASDDLLDPHSGFRLAARLSPELARQNGAFSYARAQVDGSVYLPVGGKVVVASRVRLGSILGGVTADRIAPSRRFYAGGGASVRGYGYQAIGPRDANNDPVGGKSLAEFALEARVRFGSFGVVPFMDAGNISTSFLPKLSQVRYGAGLGLRYYSNFGPIRIDVGTPLNRRKGDGRIAVYVSLGQSF